MNIGEMAIPTTHRNVTTKNDIKFMEKFNLLKEFKEEFGRFPKSREIYKGVKLGMWCSDIRGKKWRHSKDRIALLDSIGFIWDVRKHKWDTNFKLVKEFKEEFGKMPSSTEIYKGVKLGMWCDIQRHYYNNDIDSISKERIDLLNSIGFVWSIQDDRYNNNFELLKEFKEEFNRLPRQYEKYKNVDIGFWIYNNMSRCDDERKKELLRSVGVNI